MAHVTDTISAIFSWHAARSSHVQTLSQLFAVSTNNKWHRGKSLPSCDSMHSGVLNMSPSLRLWVSDVFAQIPS